jgi:hypothetical protein
MPKNAKQSQPTVEQGSPHKCHFKEVEAMGLNISHQGSLEWHHFPTKSHENLQSGSKDIYRSFMPKASNAFRLFCPTVNYMP